MGWQAIAFDAAAAEAETVYSKEDVRAALVVRFFGYVSWPDEKVTRPYSLGYLGEDSSLFRKINVLAASHKEKGRAIKVARTTGLDDLRSYDLLFVARDAKLALSSIASKLRKSATLIVSDGDIDKNNTMINLQDTGDGRVAFDINKSNIVYEHLMLSPDILLLGGTELDIAELFKETEDQLIVLRQTIDQNRSELVELKSQSAQESSMLKDLEGLYARQQGVLTNQKVEIETKETVLAGLANELKSARQLLKSNQSLLEERLVTIASRESQASELENLINNNLSRLQQQNREIATQNNSLAQQGSRIEQQQVLILVFVVGFLIISGLMALVMKLSRARKSMNVELMKARDELELRVDERTRELLVSREVALAAEQIAINANMAKSVFLANMSHEIRTPMNGVIGLVSILLEGDLTSIQRKRLELVELSAGALMDILNDILDLSKIEAGGFAINETVFSVEELVSSIIDLWQGKAREKGLVFLKETSVVRDVSVRADMGRIKQILANLVSNAIKFTRGGAVSFAVSIEDQGENTQLKFTITDTGIGISASHIENIFDPFTQADGTSTREFGGTGLGLAISKKLALMMGGDLIIDSVEGTGTTVIFSVKCPVVIEHAEASEVPETGETGETVGATEAS